MQQYHSPSRSCDPVHHLPPSSRSAFSTGAFEASKHVERPSRSSPNLDLDSVYISPARSIVPFGSIVPACTVVRRRAIDGGGTERQRQAAPGDPRNTLLRNPRQTAQRETRAAGEREGFPRSEKVGQACVRLLLPSFSCRRRCFCCCKCRWKAVDLIAFENIERRSLQSSIVP